MVKLDGDMSDVEESAVATSGPPDDEPPGRVNEVAPEAETATETGIATAEEVPEPAEEPPGEPTSEEAEPVDAIAKEVGDPAPDAVTAHQQNVANATAEVGDAALTWSRLQEEQKTAKKRFDGAVAELRRIVSRGPDDHPLFDQTKPTPATPTAPPAEASGAECQPPLKRGELRVRIGELVGDVVDNEDAPAPGDVIICIRDDDGDLWWKEGGVGEMMLDAGAGDEYEILEDWPEAIISSTVYDPPLKFGPDTEASPPTQAADADAWQTCDIAELKLTTKQVEKLDVETIGELEALRKAISLGEKDWPKGIGPAAITKIETAVLDWLKENRPTPTE